MIRMGPSRNILITGSNRGIGLGLVKEYLKDSKVRKIIATCRNRSKAKELVALEADGRVKVLELDVIDYKNDYKCFVEVVSQEIGDKGLNLLINNAGSHDFRQSLTDLTSQGLIDTFRTNCVAPLLLSKALLPLLKRAVDSSTAPSMGIDKAAIIQMSSVMASIQDNTLGGFYPYRISKTALNMGMKNTSIELKKEGILVMAMHPGWVKTEMGGLNANIDVDESVSSMVKTIAKLSEKDHGAYLRYDNTSIAW
uniref:C-factor n=1 Tax=Caligus clemensi TaxID=344056 RepID=C1C2S2_CALCM|nr:C-factor [Caligus clemensi]